MDEYLIRYFPEYSPGTLPLPALEALHQFDLTQPC